MPYSSEHKRNTRRKVVEAARVLFNRHGFRDVTIDMVMQQAGLTRGGFYNHFASKEALYAEAVSSFLQGRGGQWRTAIGVEPGAPTADMAQRMLKGYLSSEHLDDLDGQCPLIALPSDVARDQPEVRAAYQSLLEAMVGVFAQGDANEAANSRSTSLALAALCVGGMVLARTLPESRLAEEVRLAALQVATEIAL